MHKSLRLVVIATLVALPLAGCLKAEEPTPDVKVRSIASDSVASLTVESVTENLNYADLLILANDKPYRFGPHMDAAEGYYEVQGKNEGSNPVGFGDVIRVPVTGAVDLELRQISTGMSFMQLKVNVQDHTPPTAALLSSPAQGARAVERQVHFEWTPVSDASGVRYQLEYWPKVGADANTPPTVVSAIAGESHSVAQSEKLLPGQTYAWHVRAIDGLGNVGPWSETWEFTTGL